MPRRPVCDTHLWQASADTVVWVIRLCEPAKVFSPAVPTRTKVRAAAADVRVPARVAEHALECLRTLGPATFSQDSRAPLEILVIEDDDDEMRPDSPQVFMIDSGQSKKAVNGAKRDTVPTSSFEAESKDMPPSVRQSWAETVESPKDPQFSLRPKSQRGNSAGASRLSTASADVSAHGDKARNAVSEFLKDTVAAESARCQALKSKSCY